MLENAEANSINHAFANRSSADVAELLEVLDENVVMVEKLEDLEEDVLLEAVTVM
jgi:ketosteroid isomerase-like protein